jgi:6-phosphogluconolactonase (cycloisomerase 2 family)
MPFLAGLLVLGGVAGCGDFWQAPSTTTSTSCTTNCTTATSGNYYILNSSSSGSSQIIGESIVSGKLNGLSGSPYAVPSTPYAMAIDPTGSFLYVSTLNGIYLYTIDASTGALTENTTAVYPNDIQAAALVVDPTGSWLLDASDSGNLFAIPLLTSGSSAGQLDTSRLINSQPPSLALGSTTVQRGGIAISPSGLLVSVALGSTGTETFPFASGNKTPIGNPLTLNKPYNSAGASVAVAFDPQSRYLYVGETAAFPTSSTGTGALRAFSIASGSPVEFTYSAPYSSGTGSGPHAILPISTGDYVYVANWNGTSTGNITGFQVVTSGTSPSLSVQNSPATAGSEPAGLAEDSSKSFLLGVNANGGPYLDTFTFDSTTAGLLDVQLTGDTGATPVAIVAAPL